MVRDKFKRDIASVMINREAIGKQLRAARKAEGLTLREAAKRAEISFQMIAKVEKEADINPSLDMLEAIASAVKAELIMLVVSGQTDKRPQLLNAAASLPLEEVALALRLLRVLPLLPPGHRDTLLSEVAIWERKYGPDRIVNTK